MKIYYDYGFFSVDKVNKLLIDPKQGFSLFSKKKIIDFQPKISIVMAKCPAKYCPKISSRTT